MEAVALARAHAGEVQRIETECVGERADDRDLAGFERAAPEQQGRRIPVAQHQQLLPRRSDVVLAQRRDRGGEQLQGVARWLLFPARDRQQPVRGEMRVVRPQCLDRGGVILGHRLHPGAASGHRAFLREHDHVIAIAAGADEPARIADMHVHAGVAQQLPGERREPIAQQRDPLRIDLDHIDPARAQRERLQHVATTTCTEHQHARAPAQAVRQRRGGASEVRQRRRFACMAGDDAGAVAVDVQAKLRRGLLAVR